MTKNKYLELESETLEGKAYYDLARLFAADLEGEAHNTAILTAIVRHRIAGCNADFLDETLENLEEASYIIIE
jgi:hypothetical protein